MTLLLFLATLALQAFAIAVLWRACRRIAALIRAIEDRRGGGLP